MIGRMPEPRLEEILALARRLAADSARIAFEYLGRGTTQRKADNTPVTDADNAIQAFILDAIRHTYPDHAVRAEEVLPKSQVFPDPARSRYCWVVDPLDGTRNYTSRFPCFSTSLAVLNEGRPVVGVVYEHNFRWLFAALSGGGATLNGEPICVEEPQPGGDMLIGIPSSKDRLTVNVLMKWLVTQGMILRNLGSTAVHLGMVASGMLAAAFCKRAKIWDVAAGALLVTEAGGRITDAAGDDLTPFDLTADPEADLPFLAAPPQAHARLLGSVQDGAWRDA